MTIEATARIATAYFTHREVPIDQVARVIRAIGEALAAELRATPTQQPTFAPQMTPAGTVFDDHLVCLECRKEFRLLRTHLTRVHRMSAIQYRRKHNLPHDYPMAAPQYARVRSKMAKANDLGHSRDRAVTRVAAGISGLKRGRRANGETRHA